VSFWEAVTDNIAEWPLIRDGDLRPREARAEVVHTYAVAFWALATAGREFINNTR
jgi:hypothetical protein